METTKSAFHTSFLLESLQTKQSNWDLRFLLTSTCLRRPARISPQNSCLQTLEADPIQTTAFRTTARSGLSGSIGADRFSTGLKPSEQRRTCSPTLGTYLILNDPNF